MADGPKRAAGLKTREEIMEAARGLFLRQGFHATGMREIAHESGVSLSAVYNHFSSKEEIFEALLAARNFYGAIAAALDRAQGESVAELMENGFAAVMADLRGKEDYVPLLFIDVLEFQARHVAVLTSEAFPRILGFFQRLHVLGRRRGELREVSPIVLGRAYLGLILSSFILENVIKVFAYESIRLPLAVENWQQGLIDILLHGVLKEPQEVGRRVTTWELD